uniref:UPF0720 protein yeeF n=1 Tax=Lygus hesperus TaxID=30085 RepID=A0A146M7T9_LYGHE
MVSSVTYFGIISLCLILNAFGSPLKCDRPTTAVKPPITNYARDGPEGRVTCIKAVIKFEHLGKGESTTSASRKYVASMGSAWAIHPTTFRNMSDDAGHLIGNVLGGPRDSYNLIPQNSNCNRGAWRAVESEVKHKIENNKNVSVTFVVQPIYDGDNKRPIALEFEWKADDGTSRRDKIPNPLPPKSCT